MNWLKKKKEDAKQAAAKITNKRTAFQGEGNVLGGISGASSSVSSAAVASEGSSLKLPFAKNKPPLLSEEEQKKRRELQAKALEERGNAWEKRVATARKARLQQGEEQESTLQYTEAATSEPSSLPPPVVLSDEEVKSRELQSAQMQMGFNPYAATFSSSAQAASVINAIGGESRALPIAGGGAVHHSLPPFGETFHVAGLATAFESSESGENAAVYVLLRQDPARAMTAVETLIKILSNVLQNPTEEKFRKIRLANSGIQSKLVAVSGAIDVLVEAGFSRVDLDGDVNLILSGDAFETERVQSALNRVEVALIQLQHDSA